MPGISEFIEVFLATVRDVLPIATILVFFQFAILRRPLPNPKKILSGFICVLLGLVLFLIGLEQALFPVGRLMAQRYGNGRRRDTARVIGKRHNHFGRKYSLHHHHDIARNNEIVNRDSRHYPKTTERDTGSYPDGDSNTQPPGADCAVRQFSRFKRYGDQGRFCHGRAETNRECEGVYPVILLPIDDFTRRSADVARVGELLGH